MKMKRADNNVNSAVPSKSVSGPGKRRRRTPEEARRLILETAQALIARTGPDGLRLQDIAAAAGISHPLILHHFGSREGLVRALTRQAAAELRDKLVAAMASSDYSIEQQLDRVFDAFRDGLAQRLAWLTTVDPDGRAEETQMIMRDIADSLHARRIATAPPGTEIDRSDTYCLVHLVAAAAFGDALFGARLRCSAGLPPTSETAQRFRLWLAALIRAHTSQSSQAHREQSPSPQPSPRERRGGTPGASEMRHPRGARTRAPRGAGG
jgi:TetR/AcrR family transcriptional regulator, repressor for neighboring sulfatase